MPGHFYAPEKCKVAVITGRHAFDVPGFQAMFRSLPTLDAYPQPLEDWVADEGRVRGEYDAVLFYNFHQETPDDPRTRAAFEALGETSQGIVVLYHALLAYPQWLLWAEIVGITDRSFGYDHDQEMHVEVADPYHPITRGLTDWEMIDETYSMADAGQGSHILLTVDHPKSVRTIGWTRQFRQARVLCLELGHDNLAYACPEFRTLIERGVRWAAGQL